MVRRKLLISNLPEDVQQALLEDQPGRPINDLATEILSERYDLPFTTSGRNGRNWNADGNLVLKLPEPVWAALKQEATPYGTIREVAIQAFTDHYKI